MTKSPLLQRSPLLPLSMHAFRFFMRHQRLSQADIAEVVHCLQIGKYTVIAYCAWIH